jgi:hypothetical protein
MMTATKLLAGTESEKAVRRGGKFLHLNSKRMEFEWLDSYQVTNFIYLFIGILRLYLSSGAYSHNVV